MTIQDIITRAKNAGKVTRQDVYDVLELYRDPTNEVSNVRDFLNQFGSATDEEIRKITNDLGSYPVTYERS